MVVEGSSGTCAEFYRELNLGFEIEIENQNRKEDPEAKQPPTDPLKLFTA